MMSVVWVLRWISPQFEWTDGVGDLFMVSPESMRPIKRGDDSLSMDSILYSYMKRIPVIV